MNSHSLVVRIPLFFLFLLGVVNTLFYLQYGAEHSLVVDRAMTRLDESMRLMRMSHQEGLNKAEARKRLEALMHVRLLRPDEAGELQGCTLLRERPGLAIYACGDEVTIFAHDPRRGAEHVLRYTDAQLGGTRLLWYAFGVNLAVMLFYLYVVRRLWPLQRLKRTIGDFAGGDTAVRARIEGEDEIAQVANEFDRAIEKIDELQSSRNLFLRNIMHELKTPIAKGRLIADLIEDEKNAERLKQMFARFEYLLSEFGKIERVTSGDLQLNRKRFRMVDIVDDALDLLMLERDALHLEVRDDAWIEADFELMSAALKNLIDNAVKYGTSTPTVTIEYHRVSVASKGEMIDKTLLDRVFKRQFEASTRGLGLGLYITKSIAQKHGFSLEYEHENGWNYFSIRFERFPKRTKER